MDKQNRGKRRRCGGFSLLELTLAVAMFSGVVGIAATSLISFYVALDMQNLRVVALNHAKGVLNDMRTLRAANPNTDTNTTAFQTAVLTKYPNNTLKAGPTLLRNSTVRVTYVVASAASNPLIPTVEVRWNDLRGRPATLSISSALTDR